MFKLGISHDHIEKCLHHTVNISVNKCLYTVGSVRNNKYVKLFHINIWVLDLSVDSLKQTFSPKGKCLYENGPVGRSITLLLRAFGFSI